MKPTPSAIPREFGGLLRRLRQEQGLTLQEVAQRVGSYKGYIWEIERGRVNPPSPKFIRKFASLFRYDQNEMLRVAYLDKAPLSIRTQLKRAVRAGSTAAVTIPLLNTLASGYPCTLDEAGEPLPLLGARLSLNLPDTAHAALCVCDDAMSPSFDKGSIVLLHAPSTPASGLAFLVYSVSRKTFGIFASVAVSRGVRVEPLNARVPSLQLEPEQVLLFMPFAGLLGERSRRAGARRTGKSP